MHSFGIFLIHCLMSCAGFGLRRQRGVNSAGCERRAVSETAGHLAARLIEAARWTTCRRAARPTMHEFASSGSKADPGGLAVPHQSTEPRPPLLHHRLAIVIGGPMEAPRERWHYAPAPPACRWTEGQPPRGGAAWSRATRTSQRSSPTVPAVSGVVTDRVKHVTRVNVKNVSGVT